MVHFFPVFFRCLKGRWLRLTLPAFLFVALSGCSVLSNTVAEESSKPPSVSVDLGKSFLVQVQAMRRDLKIVLAPLLEPFFHYPKPPSLAVKYEVAEAPLIQGHLIQALALQQAMEKDVRTPLAELPRTYAHNPRRGKASVFTGHSINSTTTIEAWQDALLQSWWQRHKISVKFKALRKASNKMSLPMTQAQWWKWIEATLPTEGTSAPLEVQRRQRENKAAVLQWRLQHQDPAFPIQSIDLNSKTKLSRGLALTVALRLAGLESQRFKSTEDGAYDEWWAPATADPDARSSLMKDWSRLTAYDQHTLNMAYFTGVLDEVLENPPPKTAQRLKQWSVAWHQSLSTHEALRLLAWMDQKRLENQRDH
jgi:hypothetical protein